MGWAEDTVQEFKKLPPAGKIAVGGVVVAVAGFAVYQYIQSKKGSSTSVNVSGATPASGADAGALMGGLQSPWGQTPTTAGNGITVPIVPTGVNPLFDALGNLIGWQQQAPTTAVAPPPSTTTTKPTGGTTKTPTPKPIAAKSNNPIIPYDFFGNHKFPTQAGKPGTNVSSYSYGGTTYNVHPGAGGRVWGQPTKGGSSVLLYAPANYYKSGTGSGSESMFSMMNNPLQYLQSRTPHVTTVHPRAS